MYLLTFKTSWGLNTEAKRPDSGVDSFLIASCEANGSLFGCLLMITFILQTLSVSSWHWTMCSTLFLQCLFFYEFNLDYKGIDFSLPLTEDIDFLSFFTQCFFWLHRSTVKPFPPPLSPLLLEVKNMERWIFIGKVESV